MSGARLLKVLYDKLSSGERSESCMSGTLLNFPEFTQQIIPSGDKEMMRSDISIV